MTRHILMVDKDACRLYELFDASGRRRRGAPARVRSGTCAPTTCGPNGWTSADAAGLPILPGLVRYDEVAAGQSATRCASRAEHAARALHLSRAPRCRRVRRIAPPMGLRVRLKASVDIRGYGKQARVVLRRSRPTG